MVCRAFASSCAIPRRPAWRGWLIGSMGIRYAWKSAVPFMPAEHRTSNSADVVERVTRFCRLLRARGMPVTPSESIDAVRAVDVLDLGDLTDLHLALRALLTTRREDLALFDALFAEWWAAESAGTRPEPRAGPGQQARTQPRNTDPQVKSGTPALTRWARDDDAVDEDPSPGLSAASPNE